MRSFLSTGQQKSFGRNQVKQWWAVRLQGHTTFAKRGIAHGAILRPQVLPDLQRIRPVRQRSISADLIFWLLLYQDKSNSLRGK
jgi:hypothetical protein